jgi:RHH-type transcriptional regulator, proline utilization regulon repressor / proline dehydrogenase / delta 1-pyrroline-5-carboxylate dehydrogenase
MARAPESGPEALEHALGVLATISGRPLTDEGLSRTASELAGYLVLITQGHETAAESARHAELARMMGDRRWQLFSTLLTDRVPRLTSGADVVRQATHVLKQTGMPTAMSAWDRLQLRAMGLVGPILPGIVGAGVRERIRNEAQPFLIPGEPDALPKAVQAMKGPGVRVNVNQLGEEVLGHDEAERHMQAYLGLLATPEVDTISVKVSSICAQLNVLAWEDSFTRVCASLERLYIAAIGDGSQAAKLVMLDMEAYSDLELTHRAFVEVLDREAFKALKAGIVLQAYLPDSHAVQCELIAWAQARCARGGSPIQMRLVKGANLAVERVESSLQGWALPIYETKPIVDASFKTMVGRGLTDEVLSAVHLGIASHNLFDVSHALTLVRHRGLSGPVHFEVLAGMAGPLTRALRDLDQEVLVYSPAVAQSHLHSAVAYLVRRLDENTAEENFLRHSFDMRLGDAAWEGQREGYLESRRLQRSLDTTPKRQSRVGQDEGPKPGAFHNEPDTDFVLRAHREWLQAYIDRELSQSAPHLPLSIAGETVLRDPVDGFDPSRPGVVPYRISLATADDVQRAIDCGVETQATWSAVPLADRATLLRRVACALRAERGALIAGLMMDGGKAVIDADGEISEAIDFATYYADTAEAWAALVGLEMAPRGLTVITPPWNFPLAIPLGGVFAALVMGNPVILKPARETAHIATTVVALCHDAGIPPEALQLIVATDEVATELITNDAVQTVVLTGGTDTARLFKRLRPNLHLLAETGGKNATVVSRFADRDLAVNAIVQSAFAHAGQKCSATSLLILTPELVDDATFVAQLVDAARSMKVGSAWDLSSRVTPLIHPPSGALARGLTELAPGESWWLEPVVDATNPRLCSPGIKAGVKPGSFSHMTEFFGPLLSVLVAPNLKTALAWANDTPYGLTAGLHSLDEREQATFIAGMDAGNLYVNRTTTGAIVRRQPFGGRKASCFGPGAKAGGPNYVVQFAHMTDAEGSAPQAAPISPEVERLLGGLAGSWRAIASADAAEVEVTFSQSVDPSQVRGQDNLFRYQTHRPVLVVAFDGADVDDVTRVALGMTALGVSFELCASPGVDLGPLRSALRRGVVQAAPWSERVTSGRFARVRALGDVPSAAYEVANPHVACLDASPVLRHARAELRKVVLEQSVSVDFHRYGHLGLRELTASPE